MFRLRGGRDIVVFASRDIAALDATEIEHLVEAHGGPIIANIRRDEPLHVLGK